MTRGSTMICMQNNHIHNHIQTIWISNKSFFLSVQKFSRKLLHNNVAFWLRTGFRLGPWFKSQRERKFLIFWLEWKSYDCRLPFNSFMVMQTNIMITITLYVKAKCMKRDCGRSILTRQ